MQIEDLRRERLVFDDFNSKLEAQLAELQAEEITLVETIHQFHEQRCKAWSASCLAIRRRIGIRHATHAGCQPLCAGSPNRPDNLQATDDTAALKAQSDREQAAYETEWKQLTRVIETDRRRRVRSTAASGYHPRNHIAWRDNTRAHARVEPVLSSQPDAAWQEDLRAQEIEERERKTSALFKAAVPKPVTGQARFDAAGRCLPRLPHDGRRAMCC